MTQAAKLTDARQVYLDRFGTQTRAAEMADRFESLRDNPTFLRLLDCEVSFKQGLDPIPNRSAHETFLRASGHEFAAHEVLPRGNFLRNLFSNRLLWENYLALHGIIAARLMTKPGPLSEHRIEALYATLDRLVRGGANWTEIRKVPAITKRDYRGIGRVSIPLLTSASGSLIRILEAAPPSGCCSPDDFQLICTVHYSALRFIVSTVAWNAGRKKATVDDHFVAAEAYLKLFEVDPLDLPPLVRVGHSGYEQ